MTVSLKYKPGIFDCSSQLKFPEEDVFQAPGLLNVVIKITGSLNYKPGIFYFSSQLNFQGEDVF